MENQPDLIPAAAGELAQLAEEFCRLIDERERYSAVEFLRRVHPLLPRLYSAGLAVAPSYDFLFEAPPEQADEIEEDDDEPYDIEAGHAEWEKDRLGMKHWWMLYDSLGALLGKMDAYAEVFDPYVDPPEEPVTGTLSDDLADIYHDLTDGLAKWRRGEHAAAAERWGEYFTIHWGEHVTGALRAIRTLALSLPLGPLALRYLTVPAVPLLPAHERSAKRRRLHTLAPGAAGMQSSRELHRSRSTPAGAFHEIQRTPMLTLDLLPAEQAILREVLESAVSELGTEISGTDAKDYRDDLKDRREVLQKVIAALDGRRA